MKYHLLVLWFLYLTNIPIIVTAKVIHVPHDQETIQAAIDAAADLDTVYVRSGYYSGPGNRDIDPKGKVIKIRSDPDCLIDCGGSPAEPHRGFYIHSNESSQTVIDGFAIQNGYMLKGGGIYCDSASPTIANCNLMNNTATQEGGGLYVYTSSAIITKCRFYQNTSYYGGGAEINSSNGTLTFCWFESNSATQGGGLALLNATTRVGNCLFTSNTAVNGGAIACNFYDDSFIGHCTTSYNTADYGTGLYSNEASSVISHSILWDDPANELYCSGTLTPTLEYSDIWNDNGVYAGQGVINEYPDFISPSTGDYNLSQMDSGQSTTSPCVNTGKVISAHACYDTDEGSMCLNEFSTRTDRWGDTGVVDMGYHYGSNYCEALGVKISMPSYEYCEGEFCYCQVTVCNSYNWPLFDTPLFVVLDVFGAYYFAPSFSSYDNYSMQYPSFPVGETTITVLPPFIWPYVTGSASGISWLAALTDSQVTTIFGDWDAFNFGWKE
jgi:parallel beta-helix repeat protein/predicted outer membrane repeat protein